MVGIVVACALSIALVIWCAEKDGKERPNP
jgi:hypothetical protein